MTQNKTSQILLTLSYTGGNLIWKKIRFENLLFSGLHVVSVLVGGGCFVTSVLIPEKDAIGSRIIFKQLEKELFYNHHSWRYF